MNISKIIIPAAGIGSRFLPITKSIPKEMLPISNKPAIEYIVQEAFDAKIKDVVIVLSPDKKVIVDYFSHHAFLEKMLEEQRKSYYFSTVNTLIDSLRFHYVTQEKPLGLAHALLQAQNMIEKDEFFAVALPDDIIFGQVPEIFNLMNMAQKTGGMVIAVQEVASSLISSYGIMAPRRQLSEYCFEIESLVEKPAIDKAPSNLAIVGRYIFQYSLFSYIQKTPSSLLNNEILLPEVINLIIQNGVPVYAFKIQGKRFDTGTPVGWRDAIVHAI
ncbi:NTP transferase domain-containing protein [Candidatus Dependentiae bacterium]|nr:NTP transferase domain-containing protein [Candidatus Dependentiae bacterium]